jgi:CDGSH-type Zn-finger protein
MAKSNSNAKKETPKKVQVTTNGPYLVSGGVPLAEQEICVDNEAQSHGWRQGQKYPIQENYALCRCGHSKNKPYCDGTHAKVKFSGTETASHKTYSEQATEIVGPGLKLTDAKDLCAGARFCDRAGGVWKLAKESDKPDAKQKAVEEACDCPSGRLVIWDHKGKSNEPVFKPSIGLVYDTQAGKMGPLWVRGCIPVESADGKTYEIRNRVTLCRCGKSANKPFCDGSHLE